MLLLQNPDIINSPQMLHYMCAPHSTPSCGLRMNGDRAHHQHLQITSDKKYYDEGRRCKTKPRVTLFYLLILVQTD